MTEFASAHPYLFFLLAYAALNVVFRCWNRLLRHLNVRSHGWPPPHLDADGDTARPELGTSTALREKLRREKMRLEVQ